MLSGWAKERPITERWRHDCTPHCRDPDPHCYEIPILTGTRGSGDGFESTLPGHCGAGPSSVPQTLIVKQGANRFQVYRRAYMGYLHLDFKTRTYQQANRKIQAFLQLHCVGKLTKWGYGAICWIL